MSISGWGLHMHPLDMVKFGQLFVHEGNWKGMQVVYASWMYESIKPMGIMDLWVWYGYQWYPYSHRVVDEGLINQYDIFLVMEEAGSLYW